MDRNGSVVVLDIFRGLGPDGRAELDVNHADSDILMQPLRPFGSGHQAVCRAVLHQMDVVFRELLGHLSVDWTGHGKKFLTFGMSGWQV